MKPVRFSVALFVISLPILVTFSCGDTSVTDSGGQPGMVNTTVSGRVVDQYGTGIEGVTVEAWAGGSYSGCQQQPYPYAQPQTKETLTDADGFYEFSEESEGSISGEVQIRPLGIWNGSWHTGYSFEPYAYYRSLYAGNIVELEDFVGTPAYYVTGYITNSVGGAGDVRVELTDGVSILRTTTISTGYYYFLAPEGDYTITPIILLDGAVVDPSSRDVAVYGDDVTGQDFFVSYY